MASETVPVLKQANSNAKVGAPAPSRINWPRDDHRTIFFGRTGSGKTVGGLWLLSTRRYDRMPWIMVDYKGDKLIREIENVGATEVSISKKPPTKPGLYILRPDPEEPAAMNDYLRQIWNHEETGLFLDEGFMVPQHRPFKAFDHIMTQGRSRNIPVIACYQRPAWLSQFAMSQADFFAVYHLKKPEDRDTVDEYVGQVLLPDGQNITVNTQLPKHNFIWYDVEADKGHLLTPVPPPEAIVASFAAGLKRTKG